jgi:hypothetical protein
MIPFSYRSWDFKSYVENFWVIGWWWYFEKNELGKEI